MVNHHGNPRQVGPEDDDEVPTDNIIQVKEITSADLRHRNEQIQVIYRKWET